MKIENVQFCTVDWNCVEPTEHPGATGKALRRTFEEGNIRVRMIEYCPGYSVDDWCGRGHVLLVLEGELVTELSDGRKFKLTPGMSYQVADGMSSHRSSTEKGVTFFIVD